MRITIFLLLFASMIHAQKYDLIVTKQQDSIACSIKNNTDDSIHFEMKANYKWIMQSTPKINLVKYEMQTIDLDDYRFKRGSTVIISKRKERNPYHGKMRNSFTANSLLGICYNRLIPLDDKFALSLGAGLVVLNFPMIEATILYGGPRYYFEMGANYFRFDNKFSNKTFQVGFRYQHPKGLIVRFAPMYFNFGELENNRGILRFVYPYLSVGYSF